MLLIVVLYAITTLYVLSQQVELYEQIFMFLFSMFVFLVFTFIRLFIDSPIVGIMSMFAGGAFTIASLFISTIAVVAIYLQPEDVKVAYGETLQLLLVPIGILSLSKARVLFTPVISKTVQVGRYKKVTLLLLSSYAVGVYITAILMLAILIRDINYVLATVFFMGFAALSELVVTALVKRVD